MPGNTRGSGPDTRWRIEMLGALCVTGGQVSITHFRTQKTAVLLAYLAYHGDRLHPRDTLMELLWPQHRLEAARQSLSVALSSLRRQLALPPLDQTAAARPQESAPDSSPALAILADHGAVRLNPAVITTDVGEFNAALDAAGAATGAEPRIRSLVRAVELYRGELLHGCFDDWVLQERQWLAERYFRALSQVLEHLERESEFERALQFAQRGVRADPLREEAHQDLIRIYAAAGQPAAALRHYQEFERLLQEQLAITPGEATQALRADIERRATSHHPPVARSSIRSDLPPTVDEAGRAPATSSASQSKIQTPRGHPKSKIASRRIVLLYRRHTEPDQQLLERLEQRLASHGHQVFVDRHLAIGVEWAREIEREIRGADAVIPLLSADSIRSEMLAYEVEIAHQAAQQAGRPLLLPVRVNYTGPLPEESSLSQILDPLEHALWRGPQDDEHLLQQLLSGLIVAAQEDGAIHSSVPSPPHPLTPSLSHLTAPPVGGVLPLDSPFYVERAPDAAFHAAIARRDSIVLVKGARQMGKTSLLARGLQQAREAGARVILTDFQLVDPADMETAERLFRTLAEWLADQLELDVFPEEVWRPHLGTSVNFERYLRREVLEKIDQPIVWGMDEIDRLFPCNYSSQVFGLFRSWHNRRGLDPEGPWARLTLAMAYATEAHLFITDLNQSPFNVGTRLALEDFTLEQVADLNARSGSPLRNTAELTRFHELVNGHPYLVSRGCYEMVTRGIAIEAFEAQADRDEGIFGDHLRRLLVLLVNEPERCDAVRAVLQGGPCPTAESFYRLRSAGILAGESAQTARPRCRLYAAYLERHLR